MAAPKGHKKAGGRSAGTPNKATKDIREAFRLLIEGNLDNMTAWLKRVAVTDPDKALKIVGDLSEFILPKLQRTEHAGDKDSPITIQYDLSKLSTETIKELINAGVIRKDS